MHCNSINSSSSSGIGDNDDDDGDGSVRNDTKGYVLATTITGLHHLTPFQTKCLFSFYLPLSSRKIVLLGWFVANIFIARYGLDDVHFTCSYQIKPVDRPILFQKKKIQTNLKSVCNTKTPKNGHHRNVCVHITHSTRRPNSCPSKIPRKQAKDRDTENGWQCQQSVLAFSHQFTANSTISLSFSGGKCWTVKFGLCSFSTRSVRISPNG